MPTPKTAEQAVLEAKQSACIHHLFKLSMAERLLLGFKYECRDCGKRLKIVNGVLVPRPFDQGDTIHGD